MTSDPVQALYFILPSNSYWTNNFKNYEIGSHSHLPEEENFKCDKLNFSQIIYGQKHTDPFNWKKISFAFLQWHGYYRKFAEEPL